MASSSVEEIKNRLDIVDVIGNYIKLQKAGANYRAVCPFHSEKKPSFFVSPARQIWHCFGCSAGGDIFKFIMQIENVEFGDALRILAQKAGVELKTERPELRTERQRLYEICELAALFFEKQLKASKAGEEVKKYLLGRGISEESIKEWRLGYAPDTWQGLSDFLVGKGYRREEVEKAGLAIKNEEGHFYDRFRSRVMFPVFDLNSQIVGFGGRIFGPSKRPDGTEEAKYVNTPNTLLYDKSRILYGLDRAKMAIRRKDGCILVEGYTDVILSHQASVENVVSTSGTALTPYQLKILKRYSGNLLTAFDMDVAGDSATKRGIDLAINLGFNVKVITLPEEKDPADVISQNPKDWEEIVSKEKSIMDFYFETTFSRFSRKAGSASGGDKITVEGKKEISKILLPIIKRIPNKIEQSHWIQELSKKLDVKEEDVLEELRKTKIDGYSDIYGLEPEEIANLPPKSRKEMLEERLVTLILKSPNFIDLINDDSNNLFSPETSQLFSEFRKHFSGKNFQDFQAEIKNFQKKLSEPAASLVNFLAFRAEIEEEERPEEECKDCLREINLIEIKQKLDKISQEIKKAEEKKDFNKTQDLMQEFNKLAQELNKI